MDVFVSGGSGTIGVPLVRALVARGHRVVASTRHSEKMSMLRGLGATSVVVDALDAGALEAAVRQAAPTHVIHELTALPRTGPRKASDLDATNRLRDEGTRNLLHAAIAAGARRIVVGSFALLGSAGGQAPGGSGDPANDAVRSMESQVIEAARQGVIESIVLRYGLFYGRGTPTTDDLYVAKLFSRQVVLSNDAARRELGWAPQYPTYREGVRRRIAAAA
jgi:2-alkyl-3-oxoalkanoate reductase